MDAMLDQLRQLVDQMNCDYEQQLGREANHTNVRPRPSPRAQALSLSLFLFLSLSLQGLGYPPRLDRPGVALIICFAEWPDSNVGIPPQQVMSMLNTHHQMIQWLSTNTQEMEREIAELEGRI